MCEAYIHIMIYAVADPVKGQAGRKSFFYVKSEKPGVCTGWAVCQVRTMQEEQGFFVLEPGKDTGYNKKEGKRTFQIFTRRVYYVWCYINSDQAQKYLYH